jgi:hypothetical protein
MSLLHLTLLGGFEIRLGDGQALTVARKKAQALLAYLVVQPGESHLRDKLAALLWGGCSDQRARHTLRQALLTLKQGLPQGDPEALLIDAETVAVNRRALDVDVAALEALAKLLPHQASTCAVQPATTRCSAPRAAQRWPGSFPTSPRRGWWRAPQTMRSVRLFEAMAQALGRLVEPQPLEERFIDRPVAEEIGHAVGGEASGKERQHERVVARHFHHEHDARQRRPHDGVK